MSVGVELVIRGELRAWAESRGAVDPDAAGNDLLPEGSVILFPNEAELVRSTLQYLAWKHPGPAWDGRPPGRGDQVVAAVARRALEEVFGG